MVHKIKSRMIIVAKNKDTGEVEVFPSVDAILKNINRDRSDEWTPYNKKDWKEGLSEFTEYDLIAVKRVR